MEIGEIRFVAGTDLGDELFRRLAGLFGCQHDRRAVCIVRGDEDHLVTHHSLRANPDIGLDVAKHVAQVQRAVGVGQGMSDEESAGHYRVALWLVFYYCMWWCSISRRAPHRRRQTSTKAARATVGSTTVSSSEPITVRPRALKKRAPMGETSMGRHGKKKSSSSNGHASAPPRPPSVNASSKGCESAARPAKAKARQGVVRNPFHSAMATSAVARANTAECVAPRCPKALL